MNRRKQEKLTKASPREEIHEDQLKVGRFVTIALFLLCVLAVLVYSNTFSVPFHFDDTPIIVENIKIRDLSLYLDPSSHSRSVGFLSFALNYHFGRLDVFGYHLVNLLIHITNGFLVYWLILLLFQAVYRRGEGEEQAVLTPWIALATAFLFVLHPIQTQAVTYIVQRFASMATMFYFLAIVSYLKWRLDSSKGKKRWLWYGGALLSCVLAMKTKEISFTIPLMILLVESIFFWPLSKKKWVTLIPFLLCLLIIPVSLLILPLSNFVGIHENVTGYARNTMAFSRLEYLCTQFCVLITYLRLLVIPIGQNFDYDYTIFVSLWNVSVMLSLLVLIVFFGLALYLLWRSRENFVSRNLKLIAFGILWFFLTISVESSIIPIANVIHEHRVYLPSVGFFLVVSLLGSWAWGRWKGIRGPLALFVFIIVGALGTATYQRNLVWQDNITLWTDIVKKSPHRAKGYNKLGNVLVTQGRLDEAVRKYQTAIRLQPDNMVSHNNLGNVFYVQGRLDEAIEKYHVALALQPNFAKSHYNLGMAYAKQERMEAAIREYKKALEIEPLDPQAHNDLGIVYAKQGRHQEAIREYEAALKLKPDFVKAHNNLGLVFVAQGRLDEAIEEYRVALEFKPGSAQVHYNLGRAYAEKESMEEAIREYKKALELKPHYPKAHNNLGIIFARQGRYQEATREYEAALKLKPDYASARNNLGSISMFQGNYQEAIKHFQEALRLDPGFEEARQNLENAEKRMGR